MDGFIRSRCSSCRRYRPCEVCRGRATTRGAGDTFKGKNIARSGHDVASAEFFSFPARPERMRRSTVGSATSTGAARPTLSAARRSA